RDLKSNNNDQKLLEQGASELGYTYKRKRDHQSVSGEKVIPSSVAAEAVFSIWRSSPHKAKYNKSEFFSTFYEMIFTNLNASQMIMAVLIFRYCDNYRRKATADPEIMAQRKFSQ